MIHFDQIVLLDSTEIDAELRLAIENANDAEQKCATLFQVPICINGHSIRFEDSIAQWTANSIHELLVHGIQTNLSRDLWNEWPSHKQVYIRAVQSGGHDEIIELSSVCHSSLAASSLVTFGTNSTFYRRTSTAMSMKFTLASSNTCLLFMK